MKSRWAQGLPLQGMQFFVGASVALIVVQLATVWSTVCGISSESLTALFVACGGALIAYHLFARPRSTFTIPDVWVSASVLGAGSMALPTGLNTALTQGVSAFETLPWLCFSVPAVFIAMLVFALQYWVNSVRGAGFGPINTTTTIGAAAGLLLPLVCYGLNVVPVVVPVSVSILLTMAAWHIVRKRHSDAERPSSIENHQSSDWRQAVSAIGLAIFIHAGTRYVSALMPVTFVLLLPATAVCILVWYLQSTVRLTQWPKNSRLAIVAMLLPITVPLAFGPLVEWNLQLNATTDSVALLYAARSLQLAAIWCVGIIVWKFAGQHAGTSAPGLSTVFAFGCLGMAAATIVSAVGVSVPVCMTLGLTLTAVTLFRPQTHRTTEPVDSVVPAALPWPLVVATGMGAILVAILPFHPTSATQLLFSAHASQQYRAGLGLEVIEQSTGFRLVAEQQSKEGRLTAWRTSGDQMQLRRDGIPVGQVSTNPMTTPQPISDTLPVILPLVMHENASSILLLGDETGVGLRVCSDFPVHTVVAVRPDPATTEFARNYTWKSMKTSPLDDDRFRFQNEPVAMSIRRSISDADRFDVVVAVSPNPTAVSCLEQLTPEFYKAVRSQLTDRGVFCQRITRHDLGAVPLFRIVSSVSSVFGRVVMLHMAPGEIAIVASVLPDSLLDENLLTRMQRDHVGRALSRSGWDWSQVAALPAIDTSDPVGIFEHQEQLAAASAANAHFAFALPLQAAAWGDKAAELRSLFAPHQQRMADAALRGPGYDEFARRFSAVVQQAEILANFPDQPWPYRRSLRMEMQRNPRPPVEKIRNGNVKRIADPRDNIRRKYFISLGNVLQQAKNGSVDPLALRELTRFTAQYEPLLSYFAHHELVRIHEAAAHPGPALELRHRLHTVYFSAGNDFSVRLVTDALQQIVDDPELVADDAIRFDYVNSMLQELVRRWEMRRNYDPPSARQTQQHVDTCVAVAKRALDCLQEWSGSVGITHPQVLARRKFINKRLISPLRTYHDQVLVHRMKNETPLSPDRGTGSGDLPMLIDPADLLTN